MVSDSIENHLPIIYDTIKILLTIPVFSMSYYVRSISMLYVHYYFIYYYLVKVFYGNTLLISSICEWYDNVRKPITYASSFYFSGGNSWAEGPWNRFNYVVKSK